MQIVNPSLTEGMERACDPEASRLRVEKYHQRLQNGISDRKKYRLHYGDTPVGLTVVAAPLDVGAWNSNARAFQAYQNTLGRDRLPILEWKEVGQEADSLVWVVEYTVNGRPREIRVSAVSKAEARREAESLIAISAVIKTITQDSDQEIAVLEQQLQNAATPENPAT